MHQLVETLGDRDIQFSCVERQALTMENDAGKQDLDEG